MTLSCIIARKIKYSLSTGEVFVIENQSDDMRDRMACVEATVELFSKRFDRLEDKVDRLFYLIIGTGAAVLATLIANLFD